MRWRQPTNDRASVGAGFLIGRHFLMTCAHAINAALGRPLDSDLDKAVRRTHQPYPRAEPSAPLNIALEYTSPTTQKPCC
ncbi:MAG TPA: hypothetical protein DIW77_10635 [Chromatiaceae bacterium]|nr:hypothetical protein [Chromatiaceae bacterium]